MLDDDLHTDVDKDHDQLFLARHAADSQDSFSGTPALKTTAVLGVLHTYKLLSTTHTITHTAVLQLHTHVHKKQAHTQLRVHTHRCSQSFSKVQSYFSDTAIHSKLHNETTGQTNSGRKKKPWLVSTIAPIHTLLSQSLVHSYSYSYC